jgi:hypothetical protein
MPADATNTTKAAMASANERVARRQSSSLVGSLSPADAPAGMTTICSASAGPTSTFIKEMIA